MKIYVLILLITGVFSFSMTQDNVPDSIRKSDSLSAVPDVTRVRVDTIPELAAGQPGITARLKDFPTPHPLIVHFVIGFIIVAAFLQILNIALAKKDLAWIISFLLLAGLAAAIVASRNFHPHTEGLSSRVREILEIHEEWAEWTIRIGLAAFILQLVYLVLSRSRENSVMPHVRKTDPDMMVSVPVYKKHRGLILLIALLLAASSYCVIRAGHYGAQLVHIEGVGPQGRFLEQHHH